MVEAHPQATFWLDVADKAVKLAAVFLGGIWTYWNYRKSRTYEQKLELQLAVSVLVIESLYVEMTVGLKNLGGTTHRVQQKGSSCEVFAITRDLEEVPVRVMPIFVLEDRIEPGESISDVLICKADRSLNSAIWVRIDMRVISGRVEWRQSKLVRVDHAGVSRAPDFEE